MNETNNPVIEAIFSRRSIRRYTDEAVSREDVRTILEAGRWAPSGLNNQPWRFLAVFADDARQEALAGCTKYARIVRGAKVLICIFLEKEKMYSPVKDHQGAGACIQNMLLAAHALGLGAVWLGEIINQESLVMEKLGLDADAYELMAVLAVGHPDAEGSSSRRPLEEIMLEEF